MKNLENKVQILNENKGKASLYEYVMTQSENDPQFFCWLFDEDFSQDFNMSLTEEQQAEFDAWLLELKKEALLEKWIVVDISNGYGESNLKVTRRYNFEREKVCNGHDNYGQIVDCCNAGCYALDNSESIFASDLLLAIENEMNVKLHGFFGNEFGTSFTSIDELIEGIESLNADTAESKEMYNYTDLDTVVVREFAEKWVSENENHSEAEQWTYWDGSNHKTITLNTDFGDSDCVELDEDLQIEILLEMPESTPYIAGTDTTEDTENFVFHFDRWASNPWYCDVTRK